MENTRNSNKRLSVGQIIKEAEIRGFRSVDIEDSSLPGCDAE
jgi:hypothetical protein